MVTRAADGSSRERPLLREAARVILLDDVGRVLLFRVADDGRRPRPLWITPGGGCHDGESFEETATRELFEETGLTGETLGPCIWTRRHVFEFKGVWLDEVEQFFVVRLAQAAEISTANFEAHEVTFMPEHRWWSANEIAASGDWFAPRLLATLLPPIVRGEYPVAPFDCGV